jgi:hypothetical protein
MPVNLNDSTIYNNNVNKPTDGEKLRTDLSAIITFVNGQEAELDTFYTTGVNTSSATRVLNADSVTNGGLYYTDNTSTGTPVSAYNYGYLLHMAGVSGTEAEQTWFSSAGIYFRVKTASVWGNWRTFNTPLNYISVPTATYATATTFTMNGNAVATSGDGLYFLSVTGNKTIDISTTNVLNGRANGVSLTANTSYYLYMVQSVDGATSGYILDTTQGLTTHTIATVVYRSRQLKVLVRTDNSSNLIQDYFTNYNFDIGRFSIGAIATVNFDGTTASNLTGTFTRTLAIVTVNVTGHGHLVGHRIYFVGAGVTSSFYTVATVIDANSFTFDSGVSGTIGSTACTLQRRSIRKSANVQSVIYASTGIYAVNFIAFASDANYNLAGSHSTPGSAPCVFLGHFNGGGTTAPTTGYFHFSADRPSIGGTDTVYNHVTIFP